MAPRTQPLPFIDEHTVDVAADTDATWEALLGVIGRSFDTARTRRGARLLGCTYVDPSGPRPLAAGSVFPGFHVEAAEPGRKLALAGGHRFSEYALTFRLDAIEGDHTHLRAETRAAFPGPHGKIYRMLVIGTRGHILVTRRLLLAAIKKRAERP